MERQAVISLASDGGLSNGQGTFVVTLSGPDQELWENSGPLDGDPATSNSKRSELVGYAASLELFMMFWSLSNKQDLYSPSYRVKTVTWMDSTGARSHLRNLKQCGQPRHKYPHNADILAHICWLWGQLSSIDHIFNGSAVIKILILLMTNSHGTQN